MSPPAKRPSKSVIKNSGDRKKNGNKRSSAGSATFRRANGRRARPHCFNVRQWRSFYVTDNSSVFEHATDADDEMESDDEEQKEEEDRKKKEEDEAFEEMKDRDLLNMSVAHERMDKEMELKEAARRITMEHSRDALDLELGARKEQADGADQPEIDDESDEQAMEKKAK